LVYPTASRRRSRPSLIGDPCGTRHYLAEVHVARASLRIGSSSRHGRIIITERREPLSSALSFSSSPQCSSQHVASSIFQSCFKQSSRGLKHVICWLQDKSTGLSRLQSLLHHDWRPDFLIAIESAQRHCRSNGCRSSVRLPPLKDQRQIASRTASHLESSETQTARTHTK
jgi:hypothetical protein